LFHDENDTYGSAEVGVLRCPGRPARNRCHHGVLLIGAGLMLIGVSRLRWQEWSSFAVIAAGNRFNPTRTVYKEVGTY
jgi:hypothetical protein